MKKALIVWGGWDGHQPKEVAQIFEKALTDNGFSVIVKDSVEAYLDPEAMSNLSLIVPVVTMSTISSEQEQALLDAVKSGVGLAGCHGGMCDSFRNNTEYQFMTGGQWVAHPGNDGVDYTVKIITKNHYITANSPNEFGVKSEQYYLHVDPAAKVLATTAFPISDGPHVKNGSVDMPVIWTKFYGDGRVAYNSLGHQTDIVENPVILNLMTRAMLWAAGEGD